MPATPLRRDVLPIPDVTPVGPTTYDAKDPATSFPPIEPLRPPEGAPNVLVVLIDDVGFAASSAFGGPIDTPVAERLAADGLKYNRFHTTALCSPTRQALLTGRNHHSVGHGRDHGDRDVGAGLQLGPAEHLRAARRDAEAERLLDRPVRQVPRGTGLGDEPDGAVHRLADRLGLRALLRLHRRRDEPVRAGDLPGHGADRARPDARGGLPLHRGHDRPRHRLDLPAEGVDARQALLRLLRAGRHPCPPSRAAGVVGQVQGEVRRRLGRAARADVREAEGARRDPARGGAHRAPGRDPCVGRHARRPEAGARAPDGGLRGLPRAHRPPRRPAARLARRARRPREHARLLHHRRQRRLGRGHADRVLQRARGPERRRRARDDRVHGLEDRRLRHARRLQPLRGRLGARDGHAVPVDEAGRVALGRDAERHDRALAERDQGEGRDPLAVPPRDRRRRDGARGSRAAGAAQRQRGAAAAARGRLDGVHVRRRERRPTATRRSTSRCSATAASTTRAGPR